MDRNEIMAWTRSERLGLAKFLDSLDQHEWSADSLCPGWTVHDVLAHVTVVDTFRATIAGVIRARGNWNRMTERRARDWAAHHPPAQLIAQLRENAGSARRAPGTSPLDPLVDTMVHGQDIARPLGRWRAMPTEPAVAALEHVLRSRFYGARTRLRGVRLVATDTDWSAGAGSEEIRGSLSDLLLVATGRAAGLAGVTGAGAQRIADAL
ncbi:maleylpyruvate isomerase family mycothiol-dependent enzyme [Nocardia sp. NPDC049220]|uniref:maleylpyruvate isomerase family mycothiol-dependent enzyme n=1 Tax=Nocardia sp. NPDC049220 TaxID=3155273 RepID=UPI0033E4201F